MKKNADKVCECGRPVHAINLCSSCYHKNYSRREFRYAPAKRKMYRLKPKNDVNLV
jgi:hypothetical protein